MRDYVYKASHDSAAVIGQLVELLGPLASAGIPAMGVLGNHDFAPESTPDPRRQHVLADQVESALEQAGIRSLRNQATQVPAPVGGGSGQDVLYVVGKGERSARWWMPWPEYVDGWIDGVLAPGNRLYVNRGIGFSKLPVRLGAPAELTLVTLQCQCGTGPSSSCCERTPSAGGTR